MPAYCLSENIVRVARYDVLGKRKGDDDSFVVHVALLDSNTADLNYGAVADAVHMKPPFARTDKVPAHCAGSVPITNDEAKEISAWIAEIEDELKTITVREQYIVHPHCVEVADENSNSRRYTQYSCAGFVIDAYGQVGIDLLHLAEESLPEVDFAVIAAAYRVNVNHLGRYGLSGNGPWRIVLAGYVLHSLNRKTDEIRQQPYKPRPGDERF